MCPSIRLSIFYLDKCQLISPNLVCALILWRSGLGLLMCKFRQFLTELSAHHTKVAGYYLLSVHVFYYLCRKCQKNMHEIAKKSPDA